MTFKLNYLQVFCTIRLALRTIDVIAVTGDWVPLDEYYYGKKEGDPAYVEEKGEYRFKVCILWSAIYIEQHALYHPLFSIYQLQYRHQSSCNLLFKDVTCATIVCSHLLLSLAAQVATLSSVCCIVM